MLELTKIQKRFDGKEVLKELNLRVPEGETHALIGSSGSGKTTVLRITLGLIPFDEGCVRIGEQRIISTSSNQWAEQIGYVPQEGGLFPHLSARDNVTLVARLKGWKKDKVSARLDELRSIVALDASLLDRYPSELSGGQRQRVAIMRGAFLNPPVLLLDEPMGALDPLLRYSLQEELKSIFKRLKKTVVIVTHDLSEATFLAERISLIHEGRIVQTGTYAELLHYPADEFVRFFLRAQRALPEAGEAR